MIPKIIHQICPSDESKWHPIWKDCHKSWKTHYPEDEYQYMMWNDEDDLYNFVKDHYPDLLSFFESIPLHIIKIDFCKYLLLLKYGGMYVDMDMYCYKNFYDTLDADLVLIHDIEGRLTEFTNCLLAANKDNDFLMFLTEKIKKNFYIPEKNCMVKCHSVYVFDTAGYFALTRYFLQYTNEKSIHIQALPAELYARNSALSYDENMITRHMCTDTWEMENFKQASFDEIKDFYWYRRAINIDDWDYHTNYI